MLLAPPGRPAVPVDGARQVDSRTIARGSRAEALLQDHRLVSFSLLSGFHYPDSEPGSVLPAEALASRPRLPDQVAALDGQRVAVDGFMLPLDFDGASVGYFILNATQDMCMFGAPTVINQLILVRMRDGRRTALSHLPMRVFGTLDVGEEFEGDRLVSLYRMEAEAIAPSR